MLTMKSVKFVESHGHKAILHDDGTVSVGVASSRFIGKDANGEEQYEQGPTFWALCKTFGQIREACGY